MLLFKTALALTRQTTWQDWLHWTAHVLTEPITLQPETLHLSQEPASVPLEETEPTHHWTMPQSDAAAASEVHSYYHLNLNLNNLNHSHSTTQTSHQFAMLLFKTAAVLTRQTT